MCGVKILEGKTEISYGELLDEMIADAWYMRWLFGHYHDNRQVNAQDILLYEQLVRVW